VVQPLNPEQVDEFLDVLESVAAEGKWIATEAPIDRADRRDHLTAGIENGTSVMFVVEDEGRVVGGAGLHQIAPGLYDLGMMILEQWRGRGIGSALLSQCIDAAKSRQAYKISLQVWPHNDAAIALYERFGFVKEGYLRRQWRRKSGELWDAVVMGLLLDEPSTTQPKQTTQG
jgi:RimJ/RimL family protein N-acetyltransferase